MEKLNMTFEDGVTIINATLLNALQDKINELVEYANDNPSSDEKSILDWCASYFVIGYSWSQGMSATNPQSNAARCCLLPSNTLITNLADGYSKIKIKIKSGYDFVFGTGKWGIAVPGSGWFKGDCEPMEFAWVTDALEATAPLDFPLSETNPRADMFKVNIKAKDGSNFADTTTIYDLFEDIVLIK